MKFIARNAHATINRLKKSFPILAITGPRQSGKTTLAKHFFKHYDYVSLENPNILNFASNDPIGFLDQYKKGVILDEIQKVPQIFSYLQEIVDTNNKMGMFILTGSQQFGLRDKISQSLAGRIAYLELLPLSISELRKENKLQKLNRQMVTGFYPALYSRKIFAKDWYSNYVRTYIERDVNQLINIKDISKFRLFLKLCAGRIGQLINLSQLGNEVGITHTTINHWLSILEASYILFKIHPHHKNFSKRLVKTPKFYFYDVGLLCWFLGISKDLEIVSHPLRGQIFENMIIANFLKNCLNLGNIPNLYFWRDNKGLEVDLILEEGLKLLPIEIKSGQTIMEKMFEKVLKWHCLARKHSSKPTLIYGGNSSHKRSNINIVSWNDEVFF